MASSVVDPELSPGSGIISVCVFRYLQVVCEVCEHVALVVKLVCDVVLELGQLFLQAGQVRCSRQVSLYNRNKVIRRIICTFFARFLVTFCAK